MGWTIILHFFYNMSKPGQFSIFCLVDSVRSNNCLVCLISLDSAQFLYMLSKVRPAVSNKVSIIKCRRPPAKCWQSRAEQLFEIEEVSQTFLLYHKFMEIMQKKLYFLCVSNSSIYGLLLDLKQTSSICALSDNCC